MSNSSSSKQAPVLTFKDSTLEVQVWENKNKEGKVFYNITQNRSYKVGEDWKKTDQLRTHDLLPMANLLQLAYNEILMRSN